MMALRFNLPLEEDTMGQDRALAQSSGGHIFSGFLPCSDRSTK